MMDRIASFYAQPAYISGGALPVYSGSRRHRGGSILGAFKSSSIPVMQNRAKRETTEVFGLPKDIANDAFLGRNIT